RVGVPAQVCACAGPAPAMMRSKAAMAVRANIAGTVASQSFAANAERALHARALAAPGSGAGSLLRSSAQGAAPPVAPQPSCPDRAAALAHHAHDDRAAAAHASGDLRIATVVAHAVVHDLHIVLVVAAGAGAAAARD